MMIMKITMMTDEANENNTFTTLIEVNEYLGKLHFFPEEHEAF